MSRVTWRWSAAFIAAMLMYGVGSTTAHANLITVTTSADEFGTNLFACSLREAVSAANANVAFGGCPAGNVIGSDVISLPPGRYVLTRAGSGEDLNATGDLDVSQSLNITSAGLADSVVISTSVGDRLFDT